MKWPKKDDIFELSKSLVLGILSVFISKVVFIYLTGGRMDQFPFDIFVLAILASFHPLSYAVIYPIIAIAINLFHSYMVNADLLTMELGYKVVVMYSLVIIVGRFFLSERKARMKAEGRWGRVQSLATNIADEAKTLDADIPLAILKADEVFFDSAYKLNDSISKTMEMVQAVIEPYSCCLFIIEDNIFKLCVSTSPSKGLIHDVHRGKDKNFLSWIDEHAQLLLMSRVGDYKSLGYYSENEGVKAFLGVPVFNNNEHKVVGILCADRKDSTFTKHEERLLVMAANVAAEFLGHSTAASRMQMETREFSAFYKLTKMLSTTLKLEDVLKIAIDFSLEIVDYDLAAVALKEEGNLRFVSAKGYKSDALLNDGGIHADGVIRWVLEKGKSFNYPRKRRDKKVLPGLSRPLDRMGSFLCMPLMRRNESIGVFIVARKKALTFSPYAVKVLEAFSSHVAAAVSNARMYTRMETLAVKDGLTGLFNHMFFQERLSKEIERIERYGKKVTLMLLDIDFFKNVNDKYGHPAGDKVLKEFAKLLLAAVRGVDIAVRYGGEEFAVILINTDNKLAEEIAERIRVMVEERIFDIGGGHHINITASLGIAVFPDDAADKRLLMVRADASLYLAKKEGRNKVYLYSKVKDRLGTIAVESQKAI